MAAIQRLPVTADTILNDLMGTFRETIPLFLRHRMMCVGCPVAHIHDVREACAEHRVPLTGFLDDINAAIRANQKQPRKGAQAQ